MEILINKEVLRNRGSAAGSGGGRTGEDEDHDGEVKLFIDIIVEDVVVSWS